MSRLRAWILLVVLLALVVLLVQRYLDRPLDPNRKAELLNERRGAAMAELAREVLPKGAQILLVTYDAQGDPQLERMEQGFRTVAQAAGLVIADTEYVRAPERLAQSLQVDHLGPKWAASLSARHPELQAVVSLCGAPESAPGALRNRPPFICLCQDGSRVPALMKEAVVIAAYVPRRTGLTKGRSNDWFDTLYQRVLPETVAEIYATPDAQSDRSTRGPLP